MQDIMRVNQKEKRQDIWTHYDPKKAIEGIRKSRGALKGVDRETLQRDPGATWTGQYGSACVSRGAGISPALALPLSIPYSA
jgi:hypothetical protein